jgi:hypothetical protein
MKIIYGLILHLFLAACYSGKVSYSYDKGIDFTVYKTFNFIPDEAALPGDEINQNLLMDAITDHLRVKGLGKSDTPEILIDVKLLQQLMNKEVTDYARPSSSNDRVGGNAEPTFKGYVEGTLSVRIIDVANKHMVWQGRIVSTVDPGAKPGQRRKNFYHLVAQLFKMYPPDTKK